MKNSKRVISVVLCVLLMVSMLATCQLSFAFAATEGDYTYETATAAGVTTATVTKYSGTATDVTIPAKLGSYDVVALATGVFGEVAVTKVDLPVTVTKVNSAFDVESLKTVTMAGVVMARKDATLTVVGYEGGATAVIPTLEGCPVTAIADAAFKNNTTVETITMPAGKYTVGKATFAGCTALKALDLSQASSIGVGALSGCTALSELSLNNVGEAKGTAGALSLLFDGNATPDAPGYPAGLKKITVTEDNTIEAYAFKGLESLETIVIAKTIKSIGASAFEGCINLKELIGVIGGTVEAKAFYGCAALTAIDLTNADTAKIGASAFEGCTALATVTAGDGLKYVGKNAFKGTAWLNAKSGAVLLGNVFITYIGEEEEITVPAQAKAIADSALEGNVTAQKVIIPNTVEYIGINVLKGTAVVAIEIPYVGADASAQESPYIGYLFGATEAGGNASALPVCLLQVEVTGGTELAANAFNGCTSLMYLYLPTTLTKIGTNAIANCAALTKLGYNAISATVDPSALSGTSVDIVEFGKKVEIIPSYLCTGNANLTNITIPVSVTSVESRAFAGCYNIGLVIFDAAKCTSVAPDAFDYCHKLSEIELGKNVTYIPANLYSKFGSSDVTELTVPATVTEIAAGAYANCVSLTTLNYNPANCVIGDDAFTACKKLVTINLGDKVETIPTNLYTGNTAVTEVEIPAQVTRVEDYAFKGCTALKDITVADTLRSVGKNALQGTAWYNNQPDGPIYLGKIFYGYKGTMEDETLTLKDGTVAIADGALEGNSALKTIVIPGTVELIGVDALATTDATIINNSDSDVINSYADANGIPVLSTCTHNDVYYVVTAQPTATEAGTMDAYCKECGEKFAESTFTTEDELLNLWILTEAPTCTEPGVLEMNTGVTVKFNTIPATEHAFVTWKEIVAPTCTTEGVSAGFCDDCGEQLVGMTGVVAKAPHTAGEWQKIRLPRTYCTGLNAVLCTECGETLQSKTLPKLEEGSPLDFILDVHDGDWYRDTVVFVMNNNLFSGIDENYFAPGNKMTRGMFVTVLGRLAGAEVDKTVKTKFTDVKRNQYYTGYVSWAAENDIVSGVTKTTFAPNADITREQICALIVRYCDYAGIELDASKETELFRDADEISAYALESVLLCHKAGIVNGRGYNYFAPKANATRAEVAQVFKNLCLGYLVVE